MKGLRKYFTKFEIALWIISVVAVTASFMLAPNKDVLTLIASLIGVTALIFLARGYVLGQMLTVVFAVFYGIVSYFFKYYGEMITYLGMTAPIAIFSIVTWLRHPFKGSGEVAVGRMTRKLTVVMFALTAVVTVAFYFVLRALGTANMIFSTISVATSFAASFLGLMRSPYYAVAYAANDIVLIVLWSLASADNIAYMPMVLCFAMFLLNDCYGFISWQKMKKRQSQE